MLISVVSIVMITGVLQVDPVIGDKAIRAQELIGRTIGAFVDRQLTGQDVLTREQIIERLAKGDPERRKMAEQLFNTPRSFEEGANEATKARFRSTGVG